MFGTYEKFNFVRATFARSGSADYIIEDYHRPGVLRLGGTRQGEMQSITGFLFDLKLTVNGAPVKYTYFADEGSILLENGEATVEIAFTDRGHLRVYGENAGLTLELRGAADGGARACRGIIALPDGSGYEGEFGKAGKRLYKALAGAVLADSVFDNATGVCTSLKIHLLPDAATGILEAAVHEYTGAVTPFGEYEEFEDLVDNNKADFAAWRAIYQGAAKGYEDGAKYAAWTTWSHRSVVTDKLVEPVILFQNSWLTTGASWQQSYNAMPMLDNPREAWRQICTMFNYQDARTGRLPGMLTYAGGNTGMQPPFQGFALDFIRRKIGDDFLTRDECARMYPKFAKWANYWTTYRSAGLGDDVTAILSPHESGWDDASCFTDGFPASDPNNLAFLVLLFESVARLALGAGLDGDAAAWQLRAEKLTETIIDEFWNGELFVTKVKGHDVVSLTLAAYQPIILGKRLPQNIIDKVAEKLTEEGAFLTGIGLASESMRSPTATFDVSFVNGRVAAPQNMILTVGLQAAGKQAEADLIARRFCAHVQNEGVILGYAPYTYLPATGETATEPVPPHVTDGWPWSSWCANSYLTMSTQVIGK
ncbi:MAG: hypothetical protein LBS90_05675 [Oscillospiraceae bacterium]|jgi:hypothetical protein|nr:hypothetical protein [Oscillospiraceae bacterium]